jgi:hypothetical protein
LSSNKAADAFEGVGEISKVTLPCSRRDGQAQRAASKRRRCTERYKAELWLTDCLGERPAVTWDTAVLEWMEAHQSLVTIETRKEQLRFASTYLAGKPCGDRSRGHV